MSTTFGGSGSWITVLGPSDRLDLTDGDGGSGGGKDQSLPSIGNLLLGAGGAQRSQLDMLNNTSDDLSDVEFTQIWSRFKPFG